MKLAAVVRSLLRKRNDRARAPALLEKLKTMNEALKQVAELLSGGVRRSDVVARIGGDEFAILLENADEACAHETASRLVDLVCDCEFLHDGDELPLSVAIGVAMIDGADTPAAVMARADEEMYRRKAAA